MGVSTFLVSDASKTYFDLGKVFFDDEAIESIKEKTTDKDLREEIFAWLQDDSYNHPSPTKEAAAMAANIATWMQAHADWRFLSDAHDEFDDVYLAVDEGDAKEYLDEFGDDCEPIYTKDGSI